MQEEDLFNYESGIEQLSGLPLDLQSRALRGGIAADFSLRGSTFQQVLVLLNGQRINDPQTGHFNADLPLTKEDLEKISLMPGAVSSLFGPDAIAGAVNFIAKRPEENKVILEVAAGNPQGGYSLFSLSRKLNDLGLRVSVEDAQSKGYREDTDYKKFTASLNSYLQLPSGNWENNFGYQEKDFGAYDFYTPGRGYLSKEWTKTYLLNSLLNLEANALLIKPAITWRRHFDRFALDKTKSSFNIHHSDLFTPGVYLQKETGLLGRLGLGSEWGMERIISSNLGKHQRNHKSIYLDDSKDLSENLNAGFSLRLDDFDGFGSCFSGSLGARFKFNQESGVSLSVSRNIRIPSFTELYYSDQASMPTRGNSELAEEKSLSYQLGYDYKVAQLSAGAVFFLRREKDMIDWVAAPGQAFWQAQNITRDDVMGIESYLHKEINASFGISANYTYVNKCIDEQGYSYKYGPNYARHLANAVLNIRLPFGAQEVGFTYKQRPGRRGWLLVHTGFSYAIRPQVRLFLSIDNLLNTEYQDIEGIPQPGRSGWFGLRLQW